MHVDQNFLLDANILALLESTEWWYCPLSGPDRHGRSEAGGTPVRAVQPPPADAPAGRAGPFGGCGVDGEVSAWMERVQNSALDEDGPPPPPPRSKEAGSSFRGQRHYKYTPVSAWSSVGSGRYAWFPWEGEIWSCPPETVEISP